MDQFLFTSKGTDLNVSKESEFIQSRKESYRVEIRNKDRQDFFKKRQQQFTHQQHAPKELLFEMFSEYTVCPSITVLQKLKNYYQSDTPVYSMLWESYPDANVFFRSTLQVLGSSSSPEERELAAYHLNNMIYFGSKSSRCNMDLPLLLNTLDLKLRESVANELSTSAFILFCLANLYGDHDTAHSKQLMSLAPQLVEGLFKITQECFCYLMFTQIFKANISCKEHMNFTNGMMWLLRNLIYQDSTYESIGRTALQTCQYLWPDIQRYLKEGDVGFQIGEDLLFVMGHVAKNSKDEEISQFFDSHINLMVGIVTHSWPTEQLGNVVYVLKYLAMGEDDVVEQLIELGVLELMQTLLKQTNDDVLTQTLATLGYFFCLEDEQAIEGILETLGGVQLLQDLMNWTQSAVRDEAIHTLCVLIKNCSSQIPQLLQLGVVQYSLECLKQESNDMELDILEMLLTLLQSSPEIVRNSILSVGGVEMIDRSIHSKNVLASDLSLQIGEYFKEFQ